MTVLPRVQMVCHFGPPTQGLSPYGDSLARALRGHGGVVLDAVGYRAAYPQLLHPAGAGAAPGQGQLHWADPRTWRAVADAPGDILHIQHWMPLLAGYLAPLARMARRRGKRVVVTVHNTRPHEAVPLTGWLERRLLLRADTLLVHDERGLAALVERLGPGRDIRVVAHGSEVAPAVAAPRPDDRERLRLPAGRRHITLFGNLRGYKGVPVLLDAWSRIADRHPDVDLVVAGRLWTGKGSLPARLAARVLGTDREAVRIAAALARPALQGRVRLIEGFVPDDQVDALLRTSELAVFPYERFAAQSGAANRAGGLGCPLLVSDVGGLPQLAIDARWVVPPSDAAALAAALDDRLREGPEAGVREAQRQVLVPHAWSRVAADHVALYRSLLGTSSG